ncbi:MAG TPA: hypothetical protein VHA76_16595 [Solirubrobacterales bacterium]|nr:hypothetical protein [Solirubrobacterales bacterium]
MSIIRAAVKRSPCPSRRRPGHLLAGLLALSAGAVALLPAVASADAPHGAHKLVFKIDGAARQDVVGAGGIVVTARCPTEACTVVASAQGKSPSVHTGKVRARVVAGGSERMMLPLRAKDRDQLQAALRAGKAPKLIVRAMARDDWGAKVPLELTVTALRG